MLLMTPQTDRYSTHNSTAVCRTRLTTLPLVALISGILLVQTNSARAATEAARSADRFVDSIGVNTHFGNAIYTGGNAYADPGIQAKLAESGIRHIRDHSW